MDAVHRSIVEAIKAAKNVGIVINVYDELNRVKVMPISNKKFAHDVALALQTYYMEQEKKELRNAKGIL